MPKYAHYITEQFMEFIKSSDGEAYAHLSSLNDPLYLDFMVIPHFSAKSGLLADESNINSALRYLRDIGETDRYNELKKFIELFKEIMERCMWVFKSVSGISEAIQLKTAEPYYVDSKLSFTCWESVDWRMQSLLTMYRSIAYDLNDRFVEILPINLRRFQMSIYISDVKVYVNDSEGHNQRDFGKTIDHLDIDIKSTNHRMFHFGDCEFAFDAGTSHLAELSSIDMTEVEITFDLHYKTFSESSKFRTVFGDYEISGGAKNIPVGNTPNTADEDASTIDKIKTELGNKQKAFQSNLSESYKKFKSDTTDTLNGAPSVFKTELEGRAGDAVNRAITTATLRNVYTDSDLDFFRNLDTFSVKRTLDSLGNSLKDN
jgi:hypothetical protein